MVHRTVPSPPLVRPSPAADEYWFSRILSSIFLSFVANFILSLEALGRKRSREASITETTAAEAVPVGSAAGEVEVPEPPRKRVLLILSEGEDEEEVPPVAGVAVDAEVVAAEAPVVEETIAEALGTEAAVTELAVGEGIVTEATTGEAAVAGATAGEAEATTVEMVVAEVPSAEAAAVEVPSAEAAAAESPFAALTGPPFALAAVPSLAAMVPVGPSPVTPRRPRGIVIRSPPRASLPLTVAVVSAAVAVTQEPLAEDDIAVIEPLATATLILTPTASVSMSMPQPPFSQESTVMTELAVTETSVVPPAAEELATSDDLTKLHASLYEEGCSTVSDPLVEDSRAAVERLREFLFLGVHEMTTAEAFMEFRYCLDTAMALGLLDSAQLDEL
ncbi:unnamed protein product [Prunus armeniaca]